METRNDDIRRLVQDGYTRKAEEPAPLAGEQARLIGYDERQLAAVPTDANLGLGCGNPTAIATLAPGEVVVDLGCGAGMDVFLAARQVGSTGRVIGVDMTEAMLEKARANAAKAGVTNVEFRHGLIEALPVEDASVDAVISNCVINLSPEKDRVYREVYRVLKPGGRAMISDIVLERPLPEDVRGITAVYLGCVGGASVRPEYLRAVREAGFREVRIVRERPFAELVSLDEPDVRAAMEQFRVTPERARALLATVTSVSLLARK